VVKKSHFSGIIIAREVGACPEVLMQPYLWEGQRQVKFPGGMNNGGEQPVETAIREMQQETFLTAAADDLVEVHEFTPSRDPHHTKFFFVTVKFDGDPRTESMPDNGGEELLPPEWCEVTADLVESLFGQHQVALQRAMPVLAKKLESFHWLARELALV